MSSLEGGAEHSKKLCALEGMEILTLVNFPFPIKYLVSWVIGF